MKTKSAGLDKMKIGERRSFQKFDAIGMVLGVVRVYRNTDGYQVEYMNYGDSMTKEQAQEELNRKLES